MTLIHIALGRSRRRQDGETIGRCVYRAIAEALNASLEDHYHIVTQHGADVLPGAPAASEAQSDWAAIVLIYLTAPCGSRKKRALFRSIAANLSAEMQIHPQDVVVGLIETRRENWSFAYGEARYVHVMSYELP